MKGCCDSGTDGHRDLKSFGGVVTVNPSCGCSAEFGASRVWFMKKEAAAGGQVDEEAGGGTEEEDDDD